jgi:MHS family proline/betaine transporter-like MFS transporter
MAEQAKANPHLFRNTVGGVIGNILEWYDFAVFGYFAPVIGAQFFPSEDHLVSIIKAFGVFAAGYLMRPIGGVIFGFVGDRLGRKRALELSVMMMALPTTLVGLLPTYESVGILAAVLLITLRLIQGVSVGGEYIGSISFSTEIAPPKRRGLWGALVSCSASAGIMLGSAVATAAHFLLDPADLSSWGWRIPFLLGIVMGGFSLWVRTGLVETEEFQSVKRSGEVSKNPVLDTLKAYPFRILRIIALLTLFGGGFYIILVWWPTYLAKIVIPHVPHAYFMNTLAILILMALMPVTGSLTDMVGRRGVIAASVATLVIAVYPLTVWTDHGRFIPALISQMAMVVLLAGILGPMPSVLAEFFPTKYRYSGIAIPYNLTVGVIGGTAPLVCTWLVASTGDSAAPAYYVILLGLISLAAMITPFPKKMEETT